MGPLDWFEEIARTLWQMLFIAAYTAFVYVPMGIVDRLATRASS